ncbi:MAG: regulatory protein GemA [Rhizobium sp.]|nr:regulatory protein GemA [Rhizobium sp.]
MTSLSKVIHTGFSSLGIRDDADKRAVFVRAVGKDRLRDMTPTEEEAVVVELRRLGFKPASKRPKGQPDMSGKYSPKIRALWIALYNLGKVRDRRDSAITAFVHGQTAIDAVRFIHHYDDLAAIVEALKAIAKRAGVEWNRAPQIWLENDRAKIAWAQWKIIRPGATLPCRYEFDIEVGNIIGDRKTMLSQLTDEQWQVVMNALGERVRAAKKGGA